MRNARVGERVEVLRRLHQSPVDLLEAHVDRQDHERQEVVREPAEHGHRGVEQPAARLHQVQMLQQPDGRAAVVEDRLPGERADEERREEGQDDQAEQQVLEPAAPEGDDVGERVAERERHQRRGDGVVQRAQEMSAVVAQGVAVRRTSGRSAPVTEVCASVKIGTTKKMMSQRMPGATRR